MHISPKKSSGWEPSHFQPLGLLPTHHKKGKGRKKRKENSFTAATISCGSFLALSLLPLPPAPKACTFPCRSQEGVGKNKTKQKNQQGGPDFGMFLILCALPPFLAPNLLFPISAPPRAVLPGCHGVINEQQILLWEAVFMPPISLKSHCQESHSLLGMCKSSGCS